MKAWRIVAVLLLCLVLAGSIACNPFGGGQEEVSQQLIKVVRGDLTVSVSGGGNIEVAKEAKLAFGSGGRVDKVYVKEGDKVSKGKVLASLDTKALELAVAQTKAAVTEARVALELAKFNLDRMEDVDEAKDKITDAEWEVKIAKMRLKEANDSGDDYATRYWRTELVLAQIKLAEKQQDLAELLGKDEYASLVVNEVIIKRRQVEAAEQSLELAQKSLEQAQNQLDEATITAPFDGVIASVNADEGDVIPAPTMSPTIIIHLMDPTRMELKVEVDEIDIPEVRLGQRAIITVDALPDVQLEGEVAFISLLSREEAGVILYEVKIGFDVPEGYGLKFGMSANADIVIDERSDVLLVPSRAITEDSSGNPVVKVMVDEEVEERPVVTGISDAYDTEIVSGLSEGEVAVIERKVEPESPGGLFGG